MKLDEIPQLEPKILREFIANFWANFHQHKRFLTLSCCLERIKREQLWQQWGHKSLFAYCLNELHFPSGQANAYISAYLRLKALGINSQEMATLEREQTLLRVLKATKVAKDRKTVLALLQLRDDDFRVAIRSCTKRFAWNRRWYFHSRG